MTTIMRPGVSAEGFETLGHIHASNNLVFRRYRMITSDSLSYMIDFRDSLNCSRIERAQSGEEIQVLVCPEEEPLADPVYGKGTRSQDGALFVVEFTTTAGKQQSFEWEYPLLKLVSQLLQPRPYQI